MSSTFATVQWYAVNVKWAMAESSTTYPQVSFQGDTQYVVFLILVIACVSWRYVRFSSDACESHRSGAVAVVMAVGRPHVRSRFCESSGGGEGCALAVPLGENEHFVVLFQWSDCVASRDVPSRFVSDARSDVGWVEVGWTGPLGGALRFSPPVWTFLETVKFGSGASARLEVDGPEVVLTRRPVSRPKGRIF